MDEQLFYDIIGILGAALILLGFYRMSIGRWKSQSFIYELDNLVGASFLAAYQLHQQAYITVVLNIIWAIIAFRGMTSFAERRHKPHKKTRRKAH